MLSFTTSSHNIARIIKDMRKSNTDKTMRTYSLCCFIYNNNVKATIPFTEKSWTTEAKGAEDLPVIQKSERKLHNFT